MFTSAIVIIITADEESSSVVITTPVRMPRDTLRVERPGHSFSLSPEMALRPPERSSESKQKKYKARQQGQ